MAKTPVRDWLTTEEAAQILGVSPMRIRQLMDDNIRPSVLPNSILVTRTWLHYRGDVERLKVRREKELAQKELEKKASGAE